MKKSVNKSPKLAIKESLKTTRPRSVLKPSSLPLEKTSSPPVSVIIPAFNAKTYLKDAIDSALKQTHENVEVIVVDDGSTDGTKEALTSYIAEDLIRYIRQDNRGLAAARNTGIRAAKGEYIALLDADDVYVPSKIEKQVAYLQFHPMYDACYCDLWHFFEHEPERLYHLEYQFYMGKDVFSRLLYANFINPLSVLIRRATFEKCGYFNESFKRSEDWEFWVRLAYRGVQFGFVAERLAKYRMRGTSLSNNPKDEVLRKLTTYQIFKNLAGTMTPRERKQHRMRSVLFFHWAKLLYARLSRFIPGLAAYHLWRQRKRLV